MPEEAVTFEHFEVARHEDGSLYELGRGAMGVTYKAYDTRLEGYVALKVINPGYLHDDVGRERFLREARAAAHLDHPNVAAIFHRGQEAGTYFYAMQFIEGETLDAYIKRRGPLPVALALRLILQAAQGLAAANARGLIHRDIKPANLMLVHLDDNGLATKGGDNAEDLLVKVIDFGLAKVVVPDKATSQLSLTGEGPIGTPYYMSPEQIDSSVGEVDARSDIYSLGVTLWYLLTGQPPFGGTQFQVFRHHISTPPPLSQLPVFVPDSVRALLERMMAKHPADRPANTRELITALRELLRTPLTADGDGARAAAVGPGMILPPLGSDAADLTLAEIGPSFSGQTDTPVTAALRQGTLPPLIPGGAPPARPRPLPPPLPPGSNAGSSPAAVPLVIRNLPPANPGPLPPAWPPPSYPPAVPKASHGRAWMVFGIVLVATLILGGALLALLAHHWNEERERLAAERRTPQQQTPEPSASPAKGPGQPIVADRKSPTNRAVASPADSGRTLTVPAQYATIQAAMDQAGPGDTVRVSAGVYQEQVKFKSGVHLLGADAANTVVRFEGTKCVFSAEKCGSGTVANLTFEHTNRNPTKEAIVAVWLSGSAIQFKDCVVKNADSIGIQCLQGDKSTVEHCEVTGAHTVGIYAFDAGTVATLRGNTVHDCGATGIVISEGATGSAEDNSCDDNGQAGISVVGKDTTAELRGNKAHRNKLSGICIQEGAAGTATENICEDNAQGGMRISDTGTTATLSKNHLKDNHLSGIVFSEGAGGIVNGNTCEANGESGILVLGTGTEPMLSGNRSFNNQLSGISFDKAAKGTAESNLCQGNLGSGILVNGKGTAPTLRNNQLRANKLDGICFRTGAGGLADANICENNERYGVVATDAGTSPVLHENKCTGNKVENVSVQSGATPKTSVPQYNSFFN